MSSLLPTCSIYITISLSQEIVNQNQDREKKSELKQGKATSVSNRQNYFRFTLSLHETKRIKLKVFRVNKMHFETLYLVN